jgi:Dna[CI] antecedent, DciA
MQTYLLLYSRSVNMPSFSIQDHLNHAEELVRLSTHAKRLMRLQQLFQTTLPPELRLHARIANLRLGKLVIHTTNSAVAAKVRQFTPRFIELLAQEGIKLTEIDVKAQAIPTAPRGKKIERPVPPNEERKHALTDLTQTLPIDSPIRGALEQLLRSMKPD